MLIVHGGDTTSLATICVISTGAGVVRVLPECEALAALARRIGAESNR
jgi:hypothetical protein